MANFNRIFPSITKKGIVTNLYENFEYKKGIGKKTNYGKRGAEVMYQLKLDAISSSTVVGNASLWRNNITANDGVIGQYAVPYYKIQSKYTTDIDSRAKFDLMEAGVSEIEVKEKITLQAINQRLGYSTLFGFEGKQGLFNQASVTTPLTADSLGSTYLSTYVPGELLEFIVAQLRKMATSSYNTLKPIVIYGTYEGINYLKSKIIPLTNYQMKGAGTATISQTLESVVYELEGMKVELVPTTYCKGIGSASKDVFIFVAPGLERETVDNDSTALLNNINPEDTVNTFMDFALELERYENPPINQKNEVIFTTIATPAYTVRQDAITVMEYQYV